jgi:hypothetical protein
MKRSNGLTLALLLTAGALVAPAAWADSAEIEPCKIVGESCSTALHGVCVKSECWSCDHTKALKHSCNRCVSAEELDAAAGAPNTAPATEPPTCSEEKEDGGCTVRQLGTERGIAAVFLAIGLGALGFARRRRGN